MAHSTTALMGATLALTVPGETGPPHAGGVLPGTAWFGVVDLGTVETEKQIYSGVVRDIVAAAI